MARNDNNAKRQSGGRTDLRPPNLVDLSPPKVAPRQPKPPRKLTPLPELRTTDSPPPRDAAPPPRHTPLPPIQPRPERNYPQYQNNRRNARDSRNSTRPARSLSPRAKKNINRFLTIVVFGGFILMLALWIFSNNALAVFIDGEHVGYIPMTSETTSESFHQEVVDHLQAGAMTEVIVTQTVTVSPSRWGTGRVITSERSSLISRIGLEIHYYIIARGIYVNETLQVIVASDSCVDQIVRMITERWRTPDTILYEFTVPWRIEPMQLQPDYEYLHSAVSAVAILDREEIQYSLYTVQDGENLTVIGRRFGITPDAIMLTNNMTHSGIQPGQELTIRSLQPLLSVRTICETVTYEPIEMPIETVYSADRALSTFEVIQEGEAGERRIAQHVTRINGVVVQNVTLDAVDIRTPIPRIIEQGTRQTVLETRPG